MAAAGGAALVAMGALTAGCSNNGGQSPSTTTTTTTTTTTSASVAPTEKSISPTGGNLFSPGVTAPGAPSVAPGMHPGINGNN
jgi:type IV secretory pathway TrbL component